MKLFFLPVLLFVATTMIGCGGSTDSGPSSNAIIPLTPGNKWIYETTYYDSTGAIIEANTDSSFVTLSTTLNGHQWFFYNHEGTRTPEDASLFRNDSRGLWQFVNEFNKEFFIFKYPASAGDIYGISLDSTLGTNQIMVVSTNAPVSTAKGVLHCYSYRVIQNDPFSNEGEIYVAPNIGIVKQTQTNVALNTQGHPDPIFGVTKVRLLKDYILK